MSSPKSAGIMFSGAEVTTVLNSLPVALVTTDLNRLIVSANQAALELFGYEMLELQGQVIELLIPERFAKHHPKLYDEFVRDATTRSMGEGRDLWGLRSDGSEFPVEVGLTVLTTEPPLYLASIIDISLRKQTELLLKERQGLLEQSLDEAKRTLEEEVSERTRLEERQRLGRELHDSLSQNLYGIGLGLRAALSKLKKEQMPDQALEYCLNLTEASLVEMRALLFKLRPKSLENVPIEDVLASHAQAVSARTQIPIDFQQTGTPRSELAFEQKYALFRIATEALHNVIKHARADQIEIKLAFQRIDIEMEIRDNGSGMASELPSGGLGLSTMRERAESVGGHFEISSGDWGTAVSVMIPWVYQPVSPTQ